MPAGRADVAELAYALDSKSSGREVMRVQLPPSAPTPYPLHDNARFVLRSGLEAVSFDRFSPQSGGDGNTHGNTRRSDTRVGSLDSTSLTRETQWPRLRKDAPARDLLDMVGARGVAARLSN